jgi:2-polyprenyl-6-hydroxyphenyl methylase/3-demethylubiquinone-9 3-methyltransferase
MDQHAKEVARGERFEFGRNWQAFLSIVDERTIANAKNSLRDRLIQPLDGRTFIDAGCGSGLFSLAARELGATVRSFDFDPQSVACTEELKKRYRPGDQDWIIETGSVLDDSYISSLGSFDVVYSWGVLHHTGDMWKAIDSAAKLVRPNGQLFIAIYNHQLYWSTFFSHLKKTYVRSPEIIKVAMIGAYASYMATKLFIKDILHFRSPAYSYRRKVRGMSQWYDWIDWLGGYPFETAKPEEIFDRLYSQGFDLTQLTTQAAGLGCNEFVFRKRQQA